MRIDGLWIRWGPGPLEFAHTGGPFSISDGWRKFSEIKYRDRPWFISKLLEYLSRDGMNQMSREIYVDMIDEYYFGAEKDA